MSKNVIKSVKGTRDFYPDQMAVRSWLYQTAKEVAESFGYQEYEAPLLETLELYAAKSGEELVKEQSYVFTDRGGQELALRPELTPSLARMVAKKQNELNLPVRWWSFGPFWRYERPQKGRTREFFQWNVDLLGVDSPEADAETVAVLATFFKRVGLRPDQVLIKVNNRPLMYSRFEAFGIPKAQFQEVSNWIDRRGKLAPGDWEEYGANKKLTNAQIKKIKDMLEDQELWKQSESLVRFFAAIEAMGLGEYVQFDPGIVRGLMYYTGTVFEAWEVGGDIKRSILGGGRYDNLTQEVGGNQIPAVGYAMGDLVIWLILEKYDLLPDDLNEFPASVLVTIFSEEQMLSSFKLAAELRSAGLKVSVYPEPAKLGKQFKYADRVSARVALVLGPDEVEKGQVAVKDLGSGDQVVVSQDAVVEVIEGILAGASS